ncbi:MAG: hypothetical protein RLW62_20450 [Gammaproteobacteria bacterium]
MRLLLVEDSTTLREQLHGWLAARAPSAASSTLQPRAASQPCKCSRSVV